MRRPCTLTDRDGPLPRAVLCHIPPPVPSEHSMVFGNAALSPLPSSGCDLVGFHSAAGRGAGVPPAPCGPRVVCRAPLLGPPASASVDSGFFHSQAGALRTAGACQPVLGFRDAAVAEPDAFSFDFRVCPSKHVRIPTPRTGQHVLGFCYSELS